MKRLILYLLPFLPLLSAGQPINIGKVIVDSKKTFHFTQGDSSASFIIDTLIMKDKARLVFYAKKQVKLLVKHAVIGKDCLISGNDSKNNGTNIELLINFAQLKSLFIDVSGEDAKVANRHYDNGNGGNLVLSYLESGKKPQISDKRKPGYVSVLSKAGGSLVNPQNDMVVIMDRLRNGTAGRPLGQFPNGRIYSGNMGTDGKSTIKALSSLN